MVLGSKNGCVTIGYNGLIHAVADIGWGALAYFRFRDKADKIDCKTLGRIDLRGNVFSVSADFGQYRELFLIFKL